MAKARKSRTTPVQFSHIPACIREALAAHEALRRLGFPSDDIFVDPNEQQGVFVLLRVKDKVFAIGCGSDGFDPSTFIEQWQRAVALWNGTEPGMSKTTRQRIFSESILIAKVGGLSLITALATSGIVIPFGAAAISAEQVAAGSTEMTRSTLN